MSWHDDHPGPPLSHADAAAELAEELGCSADEAQQLVQNYLDETSERVGISVEDWTLDEADVDAMVASANGTSAATPTATAVAVADATAAVTAASGGRADTDEQPTAAAVAEETAGDAHEHVDAEVG
jgi:hypothetical protein